MSDSLGEFEHLVLLALLRLEPDESYGMKVRDEIIARAGRRVAIGAVYATLDRLEKKALVNSRSATAAESASGRARRFFAVTAAGKRAIRESQKALHSMSDGLDLRLA
jgi:PadR family transcriptional regulator PadR